MRVLCPMVVLSIFVAGLQSGNAAQEFELEVVSVREGTDGLPQTTFAAGRMALVDWPLRGLVSLALDIPDWQIEGWPDGALRERRFTVAATYSGVDTPPRAVQQRLVREILEDRFGMRARIERRERPVYALRLIRPGRIGPGAVKVDYNCTEPETRATRTVAECPRGGDRVEQGGLFWRASGPVEVLVSRVRHALQDRLVVDQTGLEGFYRFELLLVERGPVVRLPLPSIPELLPVQLGMTIESTRATVDIAIIDSLTMPTPN